MSQSLTTSRLWWKEWRQLRPLFAMLIVITVLLHLVFLPATFEIQRAGLISLLIGIPSLFAVGAGALLVAQEKELGTLHWLASLPVASNNLIRTKLLVACLGLVAMWGVSIGFWSIFSQVIPAALRGGIQSAGEYGAITWPLHTLYLLLAGFAVSWRLQSALVGLILLVPIALAPALAAIGLTMLADWQTNQAQSDTAAYLLIACQVAFCGGALWLAWHNAQVALRPTPAAKIKTQSQRISAPGRTLGRPYSPTSALLWQVAKQNSIVLAGCAALLLAAYVMLAVGLPTASSPVGTPAVLGCIALFVATSWLGSSVFQTDQQANQIRFLADRGASPWATWLTRQAAPATTVLLCCIAGGLLVFTLSKSLAVDPTSITVVALGLLGTSALIYIASQWASQVVTSPIVGAIAAPAVSLAVVAYAITSYLNLGSPLWVLVICSLLPLIATRCLTRRWMDGRRDKTFWSVHAGVLLACSLLPAAALGLTYASLKPMPPGIAADMQKLSAASLNPRSSVPREIVLLTESDKAVVDIETSSDETPNARLDLDPNKTALTGVLAQLNSSRGAIQLGGGVLRNLQSELELGRLHLETQAVLQQVSSSPAEGEPASNKSKSESDKSPVLERYVSWFDVGTRLAQRLRLSRRVIDQDMADYVEILLLRQLEQDADGNHLMGSQREAAIQLLSDRPARQAARRQAVADSWLRFRAYMADNQAYDIGGYSLGRTSLGNLRSQLQFQSQIGEMMENLWNLSSNTQPNTESLRTQLAEFWQLPKAQYGVGDNGKYFRADDVNFMLRQYPIYAPGIQWNAGWEEQAEALGQQVP